ncbi:hypothetical protein PR048_020237 [Dryococelus australis]|uniref:Uncharacterized protein n=1 Tax=Dryococelus australis TaxID=614101 RepID=A0ABQ9H5R6_9NEOP|nr:hypothetical protein PR048_020237 [Dryococelus australis]
MPQNYENSQKYCMKLKLASKTYTKKSSCVQLCGDTHIGNDDVHTAAVQTDPATHLCRPSDHQKLKSPLDLSGMKEA